MASTFTLVLNSNNVVANSNNTQFRYNFLNGSFRVEDGSQMCISSAIIPYSFFNISQAYGNNTFSFTFPDSTGAPSYVVTLPDGFYTMSDVNDFLQQFCITNSLYLINPSGQYVYYMVFVAATNSYANQALFFNVPTALPTASWSTPVGFHGFPATTLCPTLTISATTGVSNFGVFFGLSAGTYGGTATSNSKLSNITPVGSIINGITIRSNIVNNNVTMPSDIITSIPIDATFGSNINYLPTFEQFVNIKAGVYNNLTVTLSDQNFNQIYARDSNVILTLIIRNV